MRLDGFSVTQIFSTSQGDVFRVILPAPISNECEQGNESKEQDKGLFLSGFRDFLTSYVVVTERWNLLVDVGPSKTISSLIQSLCEMGITSEYERGKELFVLLTHVHIDHSGGLGELIEAFPDAKVLVHPRGRPHLVDPSSLWKGSIDTLGDLAYAYGSIKPVPASVILEDGANLSLKGVWESQHFPGEVEIIPTPGHASHHQSYLVHLGDETVLFLGEAAGIYLGETVGTSDLTGSENRIESVYLRPATPHRFFYDVYIDSLKTLMQLEPDLICYGHFGYTRDRSLLVSELKQLGLWKDVIWEEFLKASGSRAGFCPYGDVFLNHILERLLQEDPLLGDFCTLPEDIGIRETYFLENSIKGFVGYIENAID